MPKTTPKISQMETTTQEAPQAKPPKSGDYFDRATHTYWMDGQQVPGNTSILEENGFVDTEWFTDEGRIRGTRCHMLTQFLDEGDYDPREAERFGLTGYVESWRKAKARHGFQILAVERVLFHKLFRFGTIIDRLLLWDGYETIGELKTGPAELSHPYQTAGQLLACESALGRYAKGLRRRGCFYLHKDGSEAKWVTHTDASDRNLFLAMLTCTNLRHKHAIKVRPGGY